MKVYKVNTDEQRRKDQPQKTKDLPIDTLYKLIDQHMSYLKFLQENVKCTDENKTVVVNRVMSV